MDGFKVPGFVLLCCVFWASRILCNIQIAEGLCNGVIMSDQSFIQHMGSLWGEEEYIKKSLLF